MKGSGAATGAPPPHGRSLVKAKRLGRGLGTLLNRTEQASPEPVRQATPAGPDPEPREAGIRMLPVARLRPNPYQPRKTFSAEGLEELCGSIREHGMLQPIVVRPDGTDFEVVAGERRLRAAQALELPEVPVVVRAATDEEMQTLALVENLQREDLNAMEKARALRAMMRNFDLRQEDVATRVGKALKAIANVLRLLDLPEEIQVLVEEGHLSGAHARALLQAKGAERRMKLARLAVERGWSVREVERRARSGPTTGRRRQRAEDPYVRDLEDRLRRALTTDVRLHARGKGGRIEIRYHDANELDRLLELLQA